MLIFGEITLFCLNYYN